MTLMLSKSIVDASSIDLHVLQKQQSKFLLSLHMNEASAIDMIRMGFIFQSELITCFGR